MTQFNSNNFLHIKWEFKLLYVHATAILFPFSACLDCRTITHELFMKQQPYSSVARYVLSPLTYQSPAMR